MSSPITHTRRFLSIRHQHGDTLPVVANGQTLNPSQAHVKIKGKRGQVRVRLPATFWNGITEETEGKALVVLILDKKCNTTLDGNLPGTEEESLAEVGM